MFFRESWCHLQGFLRRYIFWEEGAKFFIRPSRKSTMKICREPLPKPWVSPLGILCQGTLT